MGEPKMFWVQLETRGHQVGLALYGDASPEITGRELLLKEGWRDTPAEAWEFAALRMEELARTCRAKAVFLTPNPEAQEPPPLPGTWLLEHPEADVDRGHYDGHAWCVYSLTGGGWAYHVCVSVTGEFCASGSAGTVACAVAQMRRAMGWSAGEGVAHG